MYLPQEPSFWLSVVIGIVIIGCAIALAVYVDRRTSPAKPVAGSVKTAKKSGGGLSVTQIVAILTAISLFLGIIIAWRNIFPPKDAPTATTTIDAFCQALLFGQYNVAYDQLSDQLQQSTSYQAFRSYYDQKTCSDLSPWSPIGNSNGFEITIILNDYAQSNQGIPSSSLGHPSCTYDVYKSSYSDDWKIDKITCKAR